MIFAVSYISSLVFFNFYDYTPWIYNDEPGYLIGARALLMGKTVVEPMSHNFPAGYSFLLLPAAFLTKNPILQYKIALHITSIISALVPVMIYLVIRRYDVKFKNNYYLNAFTIAVLLSFHPALFAYSGAVMSETLYTLILLLLFFLLFKKDVFRQRIYLALVIPLLLFSLIITRSLGLFTAASFYIALAIYVLLDPKRRNRLVPWAVFGMLILFIIYFLDRATVNLGLGHYEGADYLRRLWLIIGNPGMGTFLAAQNAVGLLFLTFFIPFFIPFSRMLAYFRRYPFQAIFFVTTVAVGIMAAVVHSIRQAAVFDNPGYFMAIRYNAPVALLLYAAGLLYLAREAKWMRPNLLLFFLFLAYFVFFFRNDGWKFANNISIMLLADRSRYLIGVFTGLIFMGMACIFRLQGTAGRKIPLLLITLLLLSMAFSLPSRHGPRFAREVYEPRIDFDMNYSDDPDINTFLNEYLDR